MMGVDSICIKDMAGILLPDSGYKLVKRIKEVTTLPLELHTHCTTGIAQIIYANAIEAGLDIIDTAMSPFSGGTSQPATEVFAEILKDTERDPKLNMEVLGEIADYLKGVIDKGEIADYLKGVIDKYRKNGIMNPKVMETEPRALIYQVPGGMLSNLMSQLSGQNAMDKYEEVLREIPKVRKDLGYPPLVTPLSQMVGTQAVFNVLPLVTPLSQMVGTQAVFNVLMKQRYKVVPKEIKDYVRGLYGKSPAPIDPEVQKIIIGNEVPTTCRPAMKQRYKVVPKEIKDYVRGLYGKSPAPIDPEVQKIIIGNEVPTTCRPADKIGPELEKYRQEIGNLAHSMEDVLSYALFPENARKFLENKYNPKVKRVQEINIFL